MKRQYRQVLPLLTAAALASFSPMQALAENPQFAHDEATWARLQDNTMEYDELSLLVEEYNPNYQNEQASYNDTKNDDDAAEIRKDAKNSADDMYDSAEDLRDQAEDLSDQADDLSDQAEAAREAGNVALAAQLQAGAASYMAGYAPLMSAAAMTQNSALKSDISADSSYVDSDMRKIQHIKNQKGIVVSTQNLFNSYNQLRVNADLIQKNVRSFLQAIGKVNKGIKVSLANEPQMFMAYNNGISTIAESIAVDEGRSSGDIVNITEITGWQIVNGGQTTASIYNAYKAKLPLEQVNVQIKLSVIKQKDRAEEIIHNISKYANSQNKINMSDFNANDAYHVKMERLSRATPIPVAKGKSTDYWFYERARGQYLVELNRQPTAAAKKEFKSRCPKNRCISKTVAAKCVMTYRGYPDIVSKGLETSFIYFSDMVSKGEVPEPSEQSYIEMIAKVILFNSCDEIIKNLKFGGFKAQQDYYTVALFGKYYSDLFDPLEIWNRQSINAETAKTIEELAYFVWNHFQNPTVPGVNIGQWCKKEECWELLQARYENEYKQG